MKKTMGMIMGLTIMAGLFTGCSSNTEGVNGKETTPSNETPVVSSDKQYTIGIGQFGEHGSLDNCREGFIAGLAEEGFVEGQNLTIINENAQFDTGIGNQIAANFVGKGVDLIAAIATPMAQSSFNAAQGKDIPVVFTAVTDPDAAMLTSGNITGTSDKLPVEAQLKLIRAMMPEAKKIGILFTTSEVNSESTIAEYKERADTYGFEIVSMGVSAAADIPLATDKLLGQVDCITNLTDNTVVGSLPLILNKANAKNIPVFGSEIEQVKLGCIASEGLEYIELGKQTGRMAAKILKGEKTADEIPFEIIEESVLYTNTEVMNKFGLTLPEDFMERAVEINN
ncbi:MAG TPA: ABC transporter substrate-binding protein [Epulopiscium sp.]|nr:ABC transporter substrate-binding protein [Candidatus Epulonipiscium sp.]